MRRTMRAIGIGLIALYLAGSARAAPSWSKDGICTACHSIQRPGTLALTNHDAIADPNDAGSLKIFRAAPGQTRQLVTIVDGLAEGDRYMVMLKGFSGGGVQHGQPLTYGADCGWAAWHNKFYTDPPRENDPSYSYLWPSGPGQLEYNLQIDADCPSDYYDLTFSLVGVPKEGTELFYSEEHFYLQVTTPTLPPTVSITSPADNTVFPPATTDVIIAANASDSDGSIATVKFFADGVLLGEDTTAPYTFTWLNAGAGNHTLIAQATDNNFATTTSAAVHITLPSTPGDFDGDRDVDQVDFGLMQRCLGGSATAGPGCAGADLNADTIVNGADIDLFERCASGPQIPSNPGCLD